MTHIRLAAVAAIVVLILSGCAAKPMIFEVKGESGSHELSFGVNTCNRNPRAIVTETPDKVRIAIEADPVNGNGEAECADSVQVVLSEPLGDRAVIDDATGDALEILDPDST